MCLCLYFNSTFTEFYTTLLYALFIFQELVKKKTKFFGGDSITMIDYMMWPFFERLEVFDLKQ